ncbi:MAG: VOC family protein, partial [Pseudomonadota bacterium]
YGHVDGIPVPIPHFGVVVRLADWRALRDRLVAADVEFVIEPTIRFEGEPGEQWTMFFRDPSGNPIEIKGFRDAGQIFAAKPPN